MQNPNSCSNPNTIKRRARSISDYIKYRFYIWKPIQITWERFFLVLYYMLHLSRPWEPSRTSKSFGHNSMKLRLSIRRIWPIVLIIICVFVVEARKPMTTGESIFCFMYRIEQCALWKWTATIRCRRREQAVLSPRSWFSNDPFFLTSEPHPHNGINKVRHPPPIISRSGYIV